MEKMKATEFEMENILSEIENADTDVYYVYGRTTSTQQELQRLVDEGKIHNQEEAQMVIDLFGYISGDRYNFFIDRLATDSTDRLYIVCKALRGKITLYELEELLDEYEDNNCDNGNLKIYIR